MCNLTNSNSLEFQSWTHFSSVWKLLNLRPSKCEVLTSNTELQLPPSKALGSIFARGVVLFLFVMILLAYVPILQILRIPENI